MPVWWRRYQCVNLELIIISGFFFGDVLRIDYLSVVLLFLMVTISGMCLWFFGTNLLWSILCGVFHRHMHYTYFQPLNDDDDAGVIYPYQTRVTSMMPAPESEKCSWIQRPRVTISVDAKWPTNTRAASSTTGKRKLEFLGNHGIPARRSA